MKKLLILAVMICFALPMIQIVDARLGEFPRGSCVDITTILNSSSVNISSISYVNTSKAVLNRAMTKNGRTFNYTFCDTGVLGVYNYDYFDDEGHVFVNDFLITNIGDTIDTGSALVYIIILSSVIFLFIIFLLVAIKTPFKNIQIENGSVTTVLKVTSTKYIKLIAIWISYGLFLWILAIITGLTNNYIWFDELRRITTNLYSWLSILGYGVSTLIWILLFVLIWKDILYNKEIAKHGKAFIERNAGGG
ncbi:hypothetical protein LCGC14_1629620 [marine sediment metagenome]|uniref:Uncharacterized protein n=1 Tax=marine sediment metagenome TaxID=412755 RepID=A0A0F9KIR1_9ZZZZ